MITFYVVYYRLMVLNLNLMETILPRRSMYCDVIPFPHTTTPPPPFKKKCELMFTQAKKTSAFLAYFCHVFKRGDIDVINFF